MICANKNQWMIKAYHAYALVLSGTKALWKMREIRF